MKDKRYIQMYVEEHRIAIYALTQFRNIQMLISKKSASRSKAIAQWLRGARRAEKRRAA